MELANSQIDCEWKLYDIDTTPGLALWISQLLPYGGRVGADPKYIPHYMWVEWENVLQSKSQKLIRINRNLVDVNWPISHRPNQLIYDIYVHDIEYAGEDWKDKIKALRQALTSKNCDAIIITSLTEVAYLLNLRGRDLPYDPVFKVSVKHLDFSYFF